MKKIIRLTESDIVKIVKRVLNERNNLREEDSDKYPKNTIGDLEENWKEYFPDAKSERSIRLITDSQDVKEIHNEFPKSKEYEGFFVQTKDGDYIRIYGFNGTKASLDKKIFKIK